MVDIKSDVTPEVNVISQPLSPLRVFIPRVYTQHLQLQWQMFASVQKRYSVHLNEIICSEHPPSSDCSDKQETDSLSLSPNKETNREPNKPVAIPLQCSHPHPGRCQVGEIIGVVYPTTTTFTPPATQQYTLTPPIFISLLLLLHHPTPPPAPSSSPLQNEMPVSDRLSQFADPCGTLPFRPGHCASRSLAKRRGIIFIPQTRGYAPMISNACLAHCQGWFWPCAKPIILISLSLYFNSHRQCKFTAEHIREIKIWL